MGKGDKQRARSRKRQQRELLGVASLAPVPRREVDGNATRAKRTVTAKQERAPDKVALQARARMMSAGERPLEVMRTQALGEPAGQAIYLTYGKSDPELAAELWQIYATFTGCEARYARVVLGKSLHATPRKVEMLPESFEAREDDQPDLRSEDEKHRDAVNAWMHWRGLIGQLHAVHQRDLFDVVRGRREAVAGGKVSRAGERLLVALELLREVGRR
ncbi:MAG: hypothetical protein VX181_02470 [Pseudomonadota bacterium]|jgi:hypothetical protein|nr:hypothetical protein [Pseudomonadota bacterium]